MAQRLFDAGAIQHARTTTPEFCCATITSSRLHGISRNPWNPRYTPGGSSGGSAAALAAGTTVLATGSDIAGSIRVPASRAAALSASSLRTGGVPQSSALQPRLLLPRGPAGAQRGRHRPHAERARGPAPRATSPRSKPRLRIPDDARGRARLPHRPARSTSATSASAPTCAATRGRRWTSSRSSGCEVEEVDAALDRALGARGLDLPGRTSSARASSSLLEEHADEMTPYARAFVEASTRSRATDYVRLARRTAGEMYACSARCSSATTSSSAPPRRVPAIAANAKLGYESFEAPRKGDAEPGSPGA